MITIIVNKRIERLYEEYMTLMRDLKEKTKEERMVLYESMTKTLFPHAKKLVDLEDQLNDARQDYQRKFKEWFFVVCKWSFSGAHFGETCFNLYKKEIIKKSKGDKRNSKIYAHKVILALGLMGYFEKVKENYSNSKKNAHGYNYEVDMMKWAELNKGVSGNTSVELDIDVDWSGYKEWYGEQQYETICSMSVDNETYWKAKTYLQKYDEYFYSTTLQAGEKKKLTDKWYAASGITSIEEHDTYFMLRHSDDSENNDEEKKIHNAGRYYTCLTNMQGDVRREAMRIDGEQVVEVDVSSAQPTMLGLLLRELYPDIQSSWLYHCEKGDFYEWLGKMTLKRDRITPDERKAIKLLTMRLLYTYARPTETPDNIPFRWYMKQYLREKNEKKKEDWERNKLFKKFDFIVMNYLKMKEPKLYELVYYYRTNLKEVKRRRPTANGQTTKERNDLSICMTKMEVKYIKACLKEIAPRVKYFYTVHDCIGCRARDAEQVKEIMQEVGRRMFGAELIIKLERGTGARILDDFKWIPEEVVMKRTA